MRHLELAVCASLAILSACAASPVERDAGADSGNDLGTDAAVLDASIDMPSSDDGTITDATMDAPADACSAIEVPCNRVDDDCNGEVDEVPGTGPLRCLTTQTHALNMNGDQYATVPGNTAFTFPSGTFTMESWVYMPAPFATYPTMISTRETGGSGNGVLFGISGRTTDGAAVGSVMLQMLGTHYTAPPPQADLQDGAWHHVAITVSGDVVKFFADGAMIGMRTITGTIASSSGLSIGQDRGSGSVGGLRGSICQVRVWNIERTEAEIRRDMDRADISTTGLVAYWPLNEGSGQLINDIAPGSSHGGALGLTEEVDEQDPIWVEIASP